MKKKKKTVARKKVSTVKSKAQSKTTKKTRGKSTVKAKSKTNSAKKTATRKRKKSAAPKSEFISPQQQSPAHSPGHRKVNILDNFTDKHGTKVHLQDSAVNQMTRADQIRRTSKTNRRIISGAAVGKTGRIVTEKV